MMLLLLLYYYFDLYALIVTLKYVTGKGSPGTRNQV